MASHIKKLLKELPFYGKTIESRIKKFANAKLLSEIPVFEKPKKSKLNNELLKYYYKNNNFINSP